MFPQKNLARKGLIKGPHNGVDEGVVITYRRGIAPIAKMWMPSITPEDKLLYASPSIMVIATLPLMWLGIHAPSLMMI